MAESEHDQNKPVAVLSGGRSISPLIPELAKPFNLAIMDRNIARQTAARGIPVANLEAWANETLKASAMNEALELCSPIFPRMNDGGLPGLFEGVLGRHGLSCNGYASSLIDWFPAWVFQSINRQVVLLKLWERLAGDFNVRVCLAHEDVSEAPKTMSAFFRSMGVPTIHVPHAVYLDLWRAAPGLDPHDELTCEWIAAAGPYQRDWYLRRGADAEKVVITGLPQWDKWSQPFDKAWAQNALKLDHDRPVVTYMSSWAQATSAYGMHDRLAESYKAFLDAAKAAGWQAVVKLHPSAPKQSHDAHIKAAREAGVKCAIMVQYLDIALWASDLVVAVGPSNTLIEAAMCDIPILSLFGFAEDSAVLTCGMDSLGRMIKVGLSDKWRGRWEKDRDGFVHKYAFANDGQAGARVLGLVKKVTGTE